MSSKTNLLALFVAIMAIPNQLWATTDLGPMSAMLVGQFTNLAQANADKGVRAVALHTARIWPNRADGIWIYVELSLVDAPEQPYKQHVWHITTAPDQSLLIRQFSLAQPITATGAWRHPETVAATSPEAFLQANPCLLPVTSLPDGSYFAQTKGKDCLNDLHGAAFATTELTLSSGEVILWDRGFNTAGRQVWGSMSGGYHFRRQR